jgi:hypothetical protein
MWPFKKPVPKVKKDRYNPDAKPCFKRVTRSYQHNGLGNLITKECYVLMQWAGVFGEKLPSNPNLRESYEFIGHRTRGQVKELNLELARVQELSE